MIGLLTSYCRPSIPIEIEQSVEYLPCNREDQGLIPGAVHPD